MRTLKVLHTLKLLSLMLALALSFNLYATDINPTTQQDWANAIQKLEALRIQNPNDQNIIKSLANAYNNQGVILAQQQQWETAEQSFKKALELTPEASAIKANLGSVYAQHGIDIYKNQSSQSYTSYNHSQAKYLADQAAMLNPNDANAYILLGDIEYFNQNMDAAQRAWQKAATLVPSNNKIQERLERITREAKIESTMNTRYDMYFLIKIDPDVEQVPNFDINQSLTDARIAVDRDFNYTPNHKVAVVVYTSDEYRQTIPDSPDWSAGQFDGKIRLILNHNKNNVEVLKSTIVHEYTHAVIAEITKNNCPRWINEGIAKYMEHKYGLAPRINYLAVAYTSNAFIPWDEIDSAIVSSNANQAMLAYQQVFSFVYYLVDKYGQQKLVSALRDLADKTDFNTVIQQNYGASLANLQNGWQAWVGPYIQRWAESG